MRLIAQRRDALQLRVARAYADLDANLIVALSGAAVRDGVGVNSAAVSTSKSASNGRESEAESGYTPS